jgi:hypothetical protein
MVRIIIDKMGGGHDDIFLKIDNVPTYIKKSDSYYLFDFLEISENDLIRNKISEIEALKFAAVELINYWNSRIGTVEIGKVIFLPFDFQDEFIGGLGLTTAEEGFNIKIVYSDQIHGYEVNKTVFDKVITDRQIKFIEEENMGWLMAYDELYNGLKWSLDELAK